MALENIFHKFILFFPFSTFEHVADKMLLWKHNTELHYRHNSDDDHENSTFLDSCNQGAIEPLLFK